MHEVNGFLQPDNDVRSHRNRAVVVTEWNRSLRGCYCAAPSKTWYVMLFDITAISTAVEISLTRPNDLDSILVRVRDHGPGVPESALEEIFQPFFRAGAPLIPDAQGTGLGLAIARRAVALHNGSIKASNTCDGGLMLTITLPSANGPPQNSRDRRYGRLLNRWDVRETVLK